MRFCYYLTNTSYCYRDRPTSNNFIYHIIVYPEKNQLKNTCKTGFILIIERTQKRLQQRDYDSFLQRQNSIGNVKRSLSLAIDEQTPSKRHRDSPHDTSASSGQDEALRFFLSSSSVIDPMHAAQDLAYKNQVADTRLSTQTSAVSDALPSLFDLHGGGTCNHSPAINPYRRNELTTATSINDIYSNRLYEQLMSQIVTSAAGFPCLPCTRMETSSLQEWLQQRALSLTTRLDNPFQQKPDLSHLVQQHVIHNNGMARLRLRQHLLISSPSLLRSSCVAHDSHLTINGILPPSYLVAAIIAAKEQRSVTTTTGCSTSNNTIIGEGRTMKSIPNKHISGRRIVVATASDPSVLSEYQCFLREHLVFVDANRTDVEVSARGRNIPIQLGQVGIMCRHCAHLPPNERPRGSSYYPARLLGLYPAAQNMMVNHFANSCSNISPTDKAKLLQLKEQNKKASRGSGKVYWGKAARLVGIQESDSTGLYFTSQYEANLAMG